MEIEKIQKIKKLLEKSKLLTNAIKDPEKELAKAELLDANNLHRLLILFRNRYPLWLSYNEITERMNLRNITHGQLNSLVDERLINIIRFEEANPIYKITTIGLNYLNNLEVTNLNKKIHRLTKILVIFGILTLFLVIMQISLAYIQNPIF